MHLLTFNLGGSETRTLQNAMKTKPKSDMMAAIHQTASDLHRAGVMDTQTLREFDETCLTPVEKLTLEQIKSIRQEAGVSQSVFALHLNVSPGLVSQWGRGKKSPAGPSLKLLQKKGLEIIL